MPEFGDYGLPSTSTLYVNGMDVNAVGTALAKSVEPSAQVSTSQRFWATPAFPVDDLHIHGLIVTLAKPKKINYLSFDLPSFPQTVYITYWDAKAKAWKDFKGPTTGSIRVYIDGSTPSIIGPASAYQSHQHPSHYGAGHWQHYDEDVLPVTTTKIRFRITRMYGSRKGGPKDVHGRPARYSLGVRGLDFGWRIRTKKDVPITSRDPDILTERESFTQVFDLLGSPVELKVRENRASDMFHGGVWKSEPMPVPYAVVNFYVDARDPQGNAQVIDRFDIMPLTSGPHLNLYYSNQVPDADFEAADSPIVFPSLRPAGELEPIAQPTGILFPDKIGYLDLDNQAIQWQPSEPFWMAIQFQPQFPSTDTGNHVIFDAGDIQLVWSDGVFRLVNQEGLLEQQPFEFGYNAQLRAIIAFDGQRLSFYMPEAVGVMMTEDYDPDLTVSTIRLGAELGPSFAEVIHTGLYRLNAMVIKREPLTFVNDENGLVVPEGVQQFLDDPMTYLSKPEYQSDEDGSTNNSILRYMPTLSAGSVNPYGFVGGPGTIFEDVVWTPVTRDYKLRAGLLQFQPVKAKFFKFEFTDLVAEPYETYQPVSRKIKTFSAAMTQTGGSNKVSEGLASIYSVGLKIAAEVAPLVSRFGDEIAKAVQVARSALPTEAMYAIDAGVQERLNQMGGLYRFDQWQQQMICPQYPTTSRHVYEQVEIGHSKRIAYFVGLSKLEMFRVDYQADDDTDQYLDEFDDTLNIDPDYLAENIVIGTTNFVLNPSFENGTTGSTLYTAGTATGGAITSLTDAAEAKFGTKLLRVHATTLGAASTDRVGFEQTYTTPDLGGSVAYSVYAKRLGGIGSLRLSLEYYDVGAVFLSSDSQSFSPQPEVESTLISNGSFSVDLTDWQASAGATVTRDTGTFRTTPASLKITPDGVTATVSGQTASASKIPVTAGTYYQAIAWLHSPAGWSDSSLAVDWFSSDQDVDYLSTSVGVAKQLPAATWMQRNETFRAPTGATHAKLRVRHGTTPAISDVLYADDIEFKAIVGDGWTRCSAVLLPPADAASVKVRWWVESGDGTAGVEYRFDGQQIQDLRLTEYVDGTVPGVRWAGTADNSASIRDAINIRPWTWDGDKLLASSGLDDPVTTQSRAFASKRHVRGIQFATSQTGSVRLIEDDDFDDPSMSSWVADGDITEMVLSEDFSSVIGSAVKITRSSAINTWEELVDRFASYDEIEASNPSEYAPTWNDMAGNSGASGYGGIRSLNPVQISQGGRVYAGARVYTDKALSGPLVLQILSSEGDVLAEKTQDVSAGKIVEWTVGYTIGDTPVTQATWDAIQARDPSPSLPTYADLEAERWNDLTSQEVAQSRQLYVRLVQYGPGEETWHVDSLTLYEDPILWEFSNDDGATWWKALDIRNNPNGVLIFPPSATPLPSTPTKLRWRVTGFRPNLHVSALSIRPWYAETVFGIPHREPGVSGGPNIQPTDHYAPIEQDPLFKQWSLPIPQDWFFLYRQLLLLTSPQVPVEPVTKPDTFTDPYRLLVPVEIIPPEPPFEDIYNETYSGPYGTATSTGIYGDTYDPSSTF